MLIVKSYDQIFSEADDFYPVRDTGIEEIPADGALGRVLAEDALAKEDIPHFRRSTVDGWAVRSGDTFGASEAFPSLLKYGGAVEMGKMPRLTVAPDTGVYVPTGGWIPDGADAMVMIEHAERLLDEILIYKSAAPGAGMVFCGDDAKRGDITLKKGVMLSAKEIGALAALGIARVKVRKKLRCAVISTGDELVKADTPFDPSGAKMRDVNSHLAAALISGWGGGADTLGIVPDIEEDLLKAVSSAASRYDMVLLSGGSSAGEKDNSLKVINALPESDCLTHGISLRPGKPTILGKSGSVAVIGLPGHPVSAFFILRTVVKRVFYRLMGLNAPPEPMFAARTAEKIPSNNGRDDFVPGVLEDGVFTPVPIKSGLITLLVRSNGFIRIRKESEGVDKGAEVMVYPY